MTDNPGYARITYRDLKHLRESEPCPRCAASAGEPCMTRTGRTAYDPHTARVEATAHIWRPWIRARREARRRGSE